MLMLNPHTNRWERIDQHAPATDGHRERVYCTHPWLVSKLGTQVRVHLGDGEFVIVDDPQITKVARAYWDANEKHRKASDLRSNARSRAVRSRGTKTGLRARDAMDTHAERMHKHYQCQVEALQQFRELAAQVVADYEAMTQKRITQ